MEFAVISFRWSAPCTQKGIYARMLMRALPAIVLLALSSTVAFAQNIQLSPVQQQMLN